MPRARRAAACAYLARVLVSLVAVRARAHRHRSRFLSRRYGTPPSPRMRARRIWFCSAIFAYRRYILRVARAAVPAADKTLCGWWHRAYHNNA